VRPVRLPERYTKSDEVDNQEVDDKETAGGIKAAMLIPANFSLSGSIIRPNPEKQ
jgi:hypothetical protein